MLATPDSRTKFLQDTAEGTTSVDDAKMAYAQQPAREHQGHAARCKE
jgi:hypothetical protein